MDRFGERLVRIKSPEPRGSVSLETVPPQELRWNQLVGAARTDTKLKGLLDEFTGACASARLHSKDPRRDMLVVIDRFDELNRYLRDNNMRQLCVDRLEDLPPIQWDGYQEIK